MVSFPNAKINLGLHITEKRQDGFHSIESCFYPVQWCDALEILASDKTSFTASGIEIPGETDSNLCLKVYNALKNEFTLPPIQIHLLKNIPIGAGLGGGSADAAFTIKLLNDLFNIGLSVVQMEDYLRPLGSDCAFFVNNKPVFAYEKGDRFSSINLSLKGHFIVIVYPEVHISTKEAYNGVLPKKPELSIETILQKDMKEWKFLLKNDFEEALFPKYPVLKEIKATLYSEGALYSSMTGSGSAVYGIFSEEKELKEVFPQNFKIWKGSL
ncbi:MAG TPA: 4-(cytidine 5'-diphospho)-2-C-methyl-D-erythritol kinase [Cytophagaceae bacterium]|jgi:4-diphosphocytidyl-2-C-methyl-D-erythritol kinase|nr:4-(cytidine 5'-diphospho)-2-C-methyl-D-erythritol kinase [Cytophagaceae bacterium]